MQATYATELQPIGVLPSRDKSSDRVSPSDDPSSSQKTSHLNITVRFPYELSSRSSLSFISSSVHRHHDAMITCARPQDWRLYIIQEFADGGPLANLYGHRALWLSPGVVNLVRGGRDCAGFNRLLPRLH